MKVLLKGNKRKNDNVTKNRCNEDVRKKKKQPDGKSGKRKSRIIKKTRNGDYGCGRMEDNERKQKRIKAEKNSKKRVWRITSVSGQTKLNRDTERQIHKDMKKM